MRINLMRYGVSRLTNLNYISATPSIRAMRPCIHSRHQTVEHDVMTSEQTSRGSRMSGTQVDGGPSDEPEGTVAVMVGESARREPSAARWSIAARRPPLEGALAGAACN